MPRNNALFTHSFKTVRGLIGVLLTCVAACQVNAAESDVHFGLTRFLALKAGYSAAQAEAIALGNQRVESGDMQFVALIFDYACLANDAALARDVSSRSYPASRQAPAAPADRAVVAGGDPSRSEARRLEGVKSSQGGFLLYELGQALHALQDSYFHAGVPDVPQMAPFFACDPSMTWAHPRERGGWSSHGADLTYRWPEETARMAEASYEALRRFPKIGVEERNAAPWNQVLPLLDGFIKAATKLDKQKWFEANGISDTTFLAGISLKDGPRPFELNWNGRRLPALPSIQSRQHDTDPKLLAFYSKFFAGWLSATDLEMLAKDNAVSPPKGRQRPATTEREELVARLRLWLLHDHGAVADLAHQQSPLSPRQRASIAALARAPGASVHYAQPQEGVFPLVTNDKAASPLLPFIVRPAPPSPTGTRRAVAIAKLRHVPYDTIGIVAEDVEGVWKVIAVVSAVDH
jgi:hypothetical protein